MARRKFRKEERRLLKRAGFGREFKGLGGLAVALEDAKFGARPAGYVQQADSCFGKRTRQRVRRERWNKRWRAMRRFCLMVAVYGGSLVVAVVLWFYLLEWVRLMCRD